MNRKWARQHLTTAIAFLLITGCARQVTDSRAVDLAQNGRMIAESQCGECHAAGSQGDSPRADAPPLRTVFSHYRADTLTEEFMTGIKVGHPDMPLFELNPQGVDSLVAYLKSIQQEPPRRDQDPTLKELTK